MTVVWVTSGLLENCYGVRIELLYCNRARLPFYFRWRLDVAPLLNYQNRPALASSFKLFFRPVRCSTYVCSDPSRISERLVLRKTFLWYFLWKIYPGNGCRERARFHRTSSPNPTAIIPKRVLTLDLSKVVNLRLSEKAGSDLPRAGPERRLSVALNNKK